MTPPSSSQEIHIKKRDGSSEELDIDKIHKMVSFACEGLGNVYPSQVEMNSGLQFYDGMKSKEIQSILVKSAEDLISLQFPNYQYVASRLMLSGLVKSLYGEFKYPTLAEHVKCCVDAGVYDNAFLGYYTDEEMKELNSYIRHDRDMEYAYASFRQMMDKYLVQDRSSGKYYETPQFMYMMIAATLFSKYPVESRLKWVKSYYDAISTHEISLPTPLLSGVRTVTRQFSSCVLIDVDDDLDSIFSSDYAVGLYTARRAGIGLNFGRIRAMGSKIRGGEVEHTGMIPFLKKFAATTRCCTQNGVRGGNSTTHFPFWHYEIEDLIVLKNNKGTDDNRVRTMDYSVQFNKLFYERVIKNEDITLFSPHETADLYEAFFGDQTVFQELYEKYERSHVRKRKINARQFALNFLKESMETGRIYAMNVDHCNTHSSFLYENVYMSNLCQEITLPTKPIDHIDDTKGEIALCTLSAINLGKISHKEQLEKVCDLAVRALDELLDYQNYPVATAGEHAPKRRSLGIGFIGMAHYLAKNKVKYSESESWQLMHDTTEAFQYYLLKSSNQLAKEKSRCEYFDRTNYANDIFPIDTYKTDVDSLIEDSSLKMDWEDLRSKVRKYGLRHSTLSAQMPAESSAVVCNETNGIEPPRNYMTVKVSKKGNVKQIVPGYPNLKNHYELLWDMKSNEGYIHIVAMMQKFFDQAISGNLSYNPVHYENNEVPLSMLLKDLLTCYKYGWKTRYYVNTADGSEGLETEEVKCDACVI